MIYKKNTVNTVYPNIGDYKETYQDFTWNNEAKQLAGLPDGQGLNIAYEAVDRHAEGELGNRVALKFITKDLSSFSVSYKDLKQETSRFANVLQTLGIEKGERVFALLTRTPSLYIAALGSLKRSAVFCPLFSVFGPEPILQRLDKGDASVLVTTRALFEKKIKPIIERLPRLRYLLLADIEEHYSDKILSLPLLLKNASDQFVIPPTGPEDPALLHFTSGTTGKPKGALHVHKAVLMHYVTGKYVMDFHPDDIFWCTADPGWVTGTSYGILSPLVNGVTNIVDEEEFDATRWYSILEREKVSIWYTAPTAIRRLMRINIEPAVKYDLTHLRLIMSVGEPLHAEAVVWGEKTFGIPVLDNWWQTETGGIVVANYPSMKVKPGSMGKPLPGLQVEIAEINNHELKIIREPNKQGHLVIKKGWPSMFRNYLHDEKRYRESFIDDWYISGDLSKKDEDGYFWFVGRSDDIIKTSGHMVGPFEVESILMEHPAVAEAAVIGKPDPVIGEIVKAFIVLKPGHTVSEELKMDITAFARKKMGPAIAPKEISFIENLPKTKSGKILRRLLKARELGLPEGDTSTLEQS